MEIIDKSSFDSSETKQNNENKIDLKIKIKKQSNFSINTTQSSSETEKSELDFENSKIIKQKIDIKNNRYPYCIVWTPLPCISWFLPFIGHTGICG